MSGDRVGAVVIKSDSEYVVRGVTEWLPKWKKNGWKNARGQPVANSTYFKEIKRLIELFEEDASVKPWLVPREQNKMADSLAVSALGGKATKFVIYECCDLLAPRHLVVVIPYIKQARNDGHFYDSSKS
jgi:ribonuclease HI